MLRFRLRMRRWHRFHCVFSPLERVRFSFRTHRRACIALASVTIIAGGAFALVTGGLVRHVHASQPVLVDPATLVHSHAAMKEARLLPSSDADENRRIAKRIDIAEGNEDGEATLFTYQHVILDLENERSSQGLIDHSPSLSVRPGDNTTDQVTEISAIANQKGVPLNVSFAKPAGAVHQTAHEIVLAPQSREKVGVLMQAADVAAEDAKISSKRSGVRNLFPAIIWFCCWSNRLISPLISLWRASDMATHRTLSMVGPMMVFSAPMTISVYLLAFPMMQCSRHHISLPPCGRMVQFSPD